MEKSPIFAWTGTDRLFPEFVNMTKVGERVEVTVRAPTHPNYIGPGDTVKMSFPADQLAPMAQAIGRIARE